MNRETALNITSRCQFYDSEIVDLAFLAMLKQILLTGSSAVPLVDAIAQISHQDIIVIFSGVLRLWLECIQIQVQTQLAFCSGSHIGFLSNTGLITSVVSVEISVGSNQESSGSHRFSMSFMQVVIITERQIAEGNLQVLNISCSDLR